MISGPPREETLGDVGGLLGPYRITGVLGRGGMGVVYRGEHVETGRLAAIKTVRAARPDLVAGIRREIQTLASVSHEGVVDVLGYGIADGLPWCAMEMLVGQTLRHLMAESGDEAAVPGASPASGTLSAFHGVPSRSRTEQAPSTRITRLPRRRSARLLAIVRRMCSALAHLHSAGIVHRDLKPDNVFIRSDGSPILVDLGLAARFSGESGREALDPYVGPIGTLHYMAPEQIRGEFVDARADLYALGCILYECVTGEPPFFGLPPPAVLTAHLEQRPTSVASLGDDVSPRIDRLITRLLEKDPHRRLGYADDVARILAEEEEVSPSPPRAPKSAAPYVYRPPFVGRHVTLEALDGVIRGLRDHSRGAIVYISGESGVGKTRVTMEATRMATQRGVPVVTGQCTSVASVRDPEVKGFPLHAFSPVLLTIADHCREHGSVETLRLFGQNGRVLAKYQPALLDTPGFSALPEPVDLEPLAARERVLSTLRATLLAYADSRPLLLVVDDLQWADELSLEVLAGLPSEPANTTGLLVIGTYRPEERRPKICQLVEKAGVLHITLERFGLGEVSALVRGMLALEQSPMPLASALERKCNGNPFFIIEYLRSAISQGLLRRDGGRWQLGPGRDLFDFLEESVAVPAGVGRLVEQRLRDLGLEAQRIVELGAVLGREFAPELVLSCAGASESPSNDAFRVLRERQIFEESASGTVRFVHDVIRETAYAQIPEERLQELHRRVASVIESSATISGPDFRTLGYHFAKGRLHEQAALYYRRAGDHAANMFANDDAIASYRAAVFEHSAAGGRARTVAAVHEDLGDLLRTTGQQERARESYDAALAGHRRGVDRARLYRKIGKTWETHHVHDRALECYTRAAIALGKPTDNRTEPFWQEYVQLTLDRLWVHYWLNRVEEMESLIESGRDSLMQRGSRFQRARFLQLVVMLRIRRERYLVTQETVTLAREAFDLGAALAEAERAALHFVVFFTLVLAGALDDAETEGTAVLSWANRAGSVMLQARCLTYLMIVARRKGQVARVTTLATECEAVCLHARLAEYNGALLANRAWVALQEERRGQAWTEAEAALVAWRTVRVPYPMQWLAIFPLLLLAVEAQRLDEAVAVARLFFEPEQQRLPEELSSALHKAIRNAPRRNDFGPAIDLAKRLKYL
jgi:eukaryotic-like serine/threonine-protein kinase